MFSLIPALIAIVIMLGATLVIPYERAVTNQTKTAYHLYLPHVDEDMDQYHWIVEDRDPKSGTFGKRMPLTFCEAVGLRPPWNEGQSLRWIKFRVNDDCLELIAYSGERDRNGNIINQ